MPNNIDELCAERDRPKKQQPDTTKGEGAGKPPWIKALTEVRHLAPREGWRYQQVQAIIVAIDQYAEATLANREFFLKKPYSIGGGAKDNIPWPGRFSYFYKAVS